MAQPPLKEVQLVAFAAPYPADYGGVIDVYYKIKALKVLGVKVHLHAFTYDKHQASVHLKELCESVYYYQRSFSAKYFNNWPYIVSSRYNKSLINKVLELKHPVILEGLHTAFLIDKLKENKHPHCLRVHNVEWKYYRMLAEYEASFTKSRYFLEESKRLKAYEQILKQTPLVTISPIDTAYVQQQFPEAPYLEILPFHGFEGVEVLTGKGEYAVFHGNLAINENEKAALWLIEEVFSKITFPLIITGKDPSEKLKRAANPYRHIRLIANPSQAQMQELLQEAQVHLLPNRQPTGMKLKWAHALHTARYIIASPDIVGSNMESAGIFKATDPIDYIRIINQLKEKEFDTSACEVRIDYLGKKWMNMENARRLLTFLAANTV